MKEKLTHPRMMRVEEIVCVYMRNLCKLKMHLKSIENPVFLYIFTMTCKSKEREFHGSPPRCFLYYLQTIYDRSCLSTKLVLPSYRVFAFIGYCTCACFDCIYCLLLVSSSIRLPTCFSLKHSVLGKKLKENW